AAWLLLTGAAIVASFSKGAYMALAVLVLVALVTVPRWRWFVPIAFATSLVVATQVPLLMARMTTVGSSLVGRPLSSGQPGPLLPEDPSFGVGLGGYDILFRGVPPEIYPHDVWLTFWVETGLVGAIAFGVILFGLLWRGWRVWPSTAGFERV